MKVIFFVPQLCSGGAQQVAILLSSALVTMGHEVYLAAATLDGKLLHRVNPACKHADLKAKKPIQAQKELANLINNIKPDALICFGIYTGIAAALSRRDWKYDPIFIIRNENNLSMDWRQGTFINRILGPILSRWSAKRAHIIAVSHRLENATKQYLKISSESITTILNPVIDDSNPLIPSSTALHPWLTDDKYPTFVAMGRLEYQKGFDVLIDAFSQLQATCSARLVIFGQGSLHDDLQHRIDKYRLSEKIDLAGHTDHPLEHMKRAHAFVLSSRFEGFGLVLVEALRAGTRVISTDCEYGPAEILENGRYGTLVPVDNVEELTLAMRASLGDDQAKPLPNNTWFKKFTAAEAAQQHISLIKSLIAHRSQEAG
ncbi:MAG: glycosyltransferase [Cellvibrionaceae bacterium]|nr:glycosyltransferase [Cellvibrionaceae bacterium]